MIQIKKAIIEDKNTFINFTVELCEFNRNNHPSQNKYDDFENVVYEVKEKARKTFDQNGDDVLILIARIDSVPAGYALGRIYDEETYADNGTGRIGLLDEIHLNSSARGQGLGEKLIRELLKWMKDQDVNRVKLHAYTWNTKAREIYKKIGFHEYAVSYEKFL